MVKSESDYLKRLREIVKEIDLQNFSFEDQLIYQNLTRDIDQLIHEEINKINCETNKDCKLKSYEYLFDSIINMIENKKVTI